MIRCLLAALVALATLVPLGAAPAMAQRPSTLSMTCREAQSLVARRGAVVLSTGRHTYDRFVVSPRYCAVAEYAYDGVAPTSDTRRCVVGYVCKNAPPLWHDDDDDGPFGGGLFGR